MKALSVAITAALLLTVSGPADGLAQQQVPYQLIVNAIGDLDCFGFGPPDSLPSIESPCGILPAPPVQEADDVPETDTTLACPTPSTITFTHTFTIPEGATILGAVWLMNLGGIETANFDTTLTIDLLPADLIVPLSETGPLGTALVFAPFPPYPTSVLEDGQLVVHLTRGNQSGSGCDDVFVDFVGLTILVSLPAP
ncbi:MAG: hypothetical protein HY724_00100 [Candidatus Rokubacteria bacterium]|nr:hypothetical protein [Candidatus Rokubacteria bacterium]